MTDELRNKIKVAMIPFIEIVEENPELYMALFSTCGSLNVFTTVKVNNEDSIFESVDYFEKLGLDHFKEGTDEA